MINGWITDIQYLPKLKRLLRFKWYEYCDIQGTSMADFKEVIWRNPGSTPLIYQTFGRGDETSPPERMRPGFEEVWRNSMQWFYTKNSHQYIFCIHLRPIADYARPMNLFNVGMAILNVGPRSLLRQIGVQSWLWAVLLQSMTLRILLAISKTLVIRASSTEQALISTLYISIGRSNLEKSQFGNLQKPQVSTTSVLHKTLQLWKCWLHRPAHLLTTLHPLHQLISPLL